MAKHNYGRKSGTRELTPILWISAEGTKTEPCYFTHIHNLLFPQKRCPPLRLKILSCSDNASSPSAVLKRMRNVKQDIEEKDLAWLVVDKDQWTNEQLGELYKWRNQPARYKKGVAFSNPCFELWLLSHRETTNPSLTKGECKSRVSQHCSCSQADPIRAIEEYITNLGRGELDHAIECAHKLLAQYCLNNNMDTARTNEYFLQQHKEEPAYTTVHFLIEEMLKFVP